MSSKSKKNSNGKASQKKTNILPFLAAAVVVTCVAVVFLVNGNGISNENRDAGNEANGTNTIVSDERQAENKNNVADREVNGAVTIVSGESLVISTADVTTDASFYPVEVDGTSMEVLAVRDSAGNIRTAFNTCQVCYDSGRGYYVQSGDYLVCQNCGNRFAMDQVEIESGGCNPWPIFDENKTVTEDEISISYDFLAESQNIFASWRMY